MKKAIIISSVVLLASCSSKILMPTQADADREAAKSSGITLTQLREGRDLFKHKCTRCHPAKNPTSRDAEEWRKVVPEMAAKAKRKGKEEISSADQEAILKYLIAMADRP